MKKKMKVSVVDLDVCLVDVKLEVQRIKDKELQVEYVNLIFLAEGIEFTVSITMSQAKKLVDILQEIIQSNEQKRGKVE